MNEFCTLFDTRLNTLDQLIQQGAAHFGSDGFLELRLVDDMFPLGTQIVFTCNQPMNFVQWVQGETVSNLDPDVRSLDQATRLVSQVRASLKTIDPTSAVLPQTKRLDFEAGRYVELTGEEYVTDFLVPNFYFHLVTAYDILRANGVGLGKANYMAHLLSRVREA